MYCSTRRTSPNLASSSIIVTLVALYDLCIISITQQQQQQHYIYIYIYYGSMEKIKFDDNMHTLVVHYSYYSRV